MQEVIGSTPTFYTLKKKALRKRVKPFFILGIQWEYK